LNLVMMAPVFLRAARASAPIQMAEPNRTGSRIAANPTSAKTSEKKWEICARNIARKDLRANAPRRAGGIGSWTLEKRNPPTQGTDRKTRSATIEPCDRIRPSKRFERGGTLPRPQASGIGLLSSSSANKGAQRQYPRPYLCEVRRFPRAQKR